MTVENWRPVVGYEGAYEVSDLSRVRSLDRITERGRRWRGRMMKQQREARTGYSSVNLAWGRKQTTWRVHRLVMLAFVGEPPDGHEVLHIDGDASNSCLNNLRWGTHSENMIDIVTHGMNPNTSKEFCPQGHPYDEENTYLNLSRGRGFRACRICLRDARRRYKARIRRESHAMKARACQS